TNVCHDLTIITDGNFRVFCAAESINGKTTVNLSITRDVDPPTPGVSVSPQDPNAAGWYNRAVKLETSCNELRSGSGSRVTLGEGIHPAGIHTCTSAAGNTASAPIPEIKIDLTAPILTATVSPNPVIFGATATAKPVASDALSGLAGPATC